MPIANYGVLVGRPVGRRPGVKDNPHYQIHVVDEDKNFRVAVNVLSKMAPSEVKFLIDEHFDHPLLNDLRQLPQGVHPLPSKPGGVALDYIRGNLFDLAKMVPLPFNVPGVDNDLNEKIDRIVAQAMADEEALIYAFGQKWPEENKRDKIFGFKPNEGVHDIHMNQGNSGQFVSDDGVWQDGGLLFHFPLRHQWVAIFLAFQSQATHTDDVTGHRIETVPPVPPLPPGPIPVANDGVIRIVAALVNPVGDDPGKETVTLLNASPAQIKLNGWKIADRLKNKQNLNGAINPGASLVVTLSPTVQLSNDGGIITLLDSQGLKVDGVAYTKQQASKQGWTIVF